jgi:hypothetical protein
MASTLPSADVVSCYLDDRFSPRVSALRLRWDGPAEGSGERLWDLPEGVCIVGPPPERFGFSIERRAVDSYTVRLIWDRSGFSWTGLCRVQLLASALAPLMHAIGSDLYAQLDGPIHAEAGTTRRAA